MSIGAEVGERSIVAEGTVVKMEQKLPASVVAVGNPARIVRKVSRKDQTYWDWGNQLYIDLAKRYLDNGIHRVD